MNRFLPAAGLFLAVAGFVLPTQAQDAQAGEEVFKTICNLCHEADEGKNRVGPSLYGVFGQISGTLPGFTYSDVLKGARLTWNQENLDRWINAPKATVPGTKMSYAGTQGRGDAP